MKALKLLCICIIGAFVCAGALASGASAQELPENLPIIKAERPWTGASDGETIKFYVKVTGGSGSLECKEAPATGKEESGKPLGLFHIEFKMCRTFINNLEEKCTGLNDTAGIILVLGTWHLVFDKNAPTELLTAMFFLIEAAHLNCGGLVLIQMSGGLLCLHLKPTEKSKTHLYHCIVEAEKQEDTTWIMSDGEALAAEVLCSVNEAAAKDCPVLLLGSVKYEEEIFADI